MATPEPRDQIQAALGAQYTLERELGRGGMAIVYLAQDTKHHRAVALKVLHPDLAASVGPERFQREIEMAARLQHPHILSVHDSGQTAAGQLWFTMPFVEGESLRDRLRRDHQLPLDETVRITREAALALQYAHEHGVVHRDIKPENLLLTRDGTTLVADFGIARAVGGSPAAGSTSLTATGMAVGTPQYMSPEQAAAERDVGPRSDVYSLAAVTYEMLAGEPPYTGPSTQAVIAKMMSGEVPSIRRSRPSVPEGVDLAIRKALAPVPADRFATVAEFAKALEAAERTTTGPATAAPPARPARRRRVPTGVALLGLGVCIGAGFLFAWRRHEGSASAGPVRLAVLPFDNLGDSADAYFADGVTDALRGKLATLPGIEVIGANSSGQYRHSAKTPQEIGRDLGARYLLVGKIRWAKTPDGHSRVQVSPELLDARTAATRWGAPFDASMTDVFQVQADVAAKVAQALGVALSAGAHDSLAAQPTRDTAAYNAYLQGVDLLNTAAGEAAAHRRAVAALRQAVSLDSGFAEAWAALAVGESLLYADGTNFSLPDSVLAAAAEVHAKRAANLAPHLGAAHLALASYYTDVAGDPRRAVAEDSLALQSTPNDVHVLNSMASSELDLGYLDAAVALFTRAATLDPRSVSAVRGLSDALRAAGRFPEAAAAAERGLRIDPTRLGLLFDLMLARQRAGDTAGARAAMVRAIALDSTNVSLFHSLARHRIWIGDLAGARSVYATPHPGVDPDALMAYAAVTLDLYWALDDAQQQRLFAMPPATFLVAAGGNPRDRYLALAHTAWLRGDATRARAYADSALPYAAKMVHGNPTNADARGLLADVEAYLGRRQDALRDAHEAVHLAELSSESFNRGYNSVQLARVFTIFHEPDSAVTALEPVLDLLPDFYSPAFFRIDPTWSPLRGNPRFQQLIAKPTPGEIAPKS